MERERHCGEERKWKVCAISEGPGGKERETERLREGGEDRRVAGRGWIDKNNPERAVGFTG